MRTLQSHNPYYNGAGGGGGGGAGADQMTTHAIIWW